MAKKLYFGTDGIRGTVGNQPLTVDFVVNLANSIGTILQQNYSKPTVVIGKDTRISGYMLESALEAGFNSAGVDVLLLGPIPTPAVAYLTKTLRVSLGVVISASHNPYPDNGIKFFGPDGAKLSDAWELAVEQQLSLTPNYATAANLGTTSRIDSASGRYIEFCKSTLPSAMSLRGLKIVVDAANGAAYKIAPKIFYELGAEVISVASEPNGLNINQHVGATHTEFLAQQVVKHQADLGVALDGDADRLMLADQTGKIYAGDEILYLISQNLINEQQPLPGVVGTLMTNMAIEQLLQQQGVGFVRAKVGDRYVMEELEKNNWFLGGENSGHLIDLRKHSTGDGLISALEVLRICLATNKSLAELLQGLQLYPQTMLNVRLPNGYQWQQDSGLMTAYQDLSQKLAQTGRILIRESGTEPLIRIMVEAQDASVATDLAKQLAAIVPQA